MTDVQPRSVPPRSSALSLALASPHRGTHPKNEDLLAIQTDLQNQPPQHLGKEAQKMNIDDIKPGTKVRYASGGPLMTVRLVGPQPGEGLSWDDIRNRVKCGWFDKDGRFCEGYFRSFELVAA